MDHLNLFIVIVQIPHLVVIPVVAKIHKICSLFSVVFISVIILSCVGETRNTNEKVIDVSECQEKSFDWISLLDKNIQYVKLNTDSEKYSFSNISKLICWNNRFYVNDWRIRRLITFDDKGNPLFVLNRRGRGPEEYLQVTDFDVDDNGGLWILDGQKDVVNHYASGGKFLSQTKTGDSQYSYISYEKGKLLLGVAYWDKSENSGYTAVLADTSLNVSARYGQVPEFYDADFTFPSVGFAHVGDVVMSNNPIDDCVSVFDKKGYKGRYFFDFGAKCVPDEVRKSVEKHLDELSDYTFLVNVVGAYDNMVIGTFMDGGAPVDFVIDTKSKMLYKQPWSSGQFHLTSISSDEIVLSGVDFDSGRTNIAYISLDEIKKVMKRN